LRRFCAGFGFADARRRGVISFARATAYLARRREQYETDGGRRKARIAKRRAVKLAAIPAGAEVTEIDRAWAKLSRKAKALGLTIDHVTPLRPCRVCHAKGEHHPRNWQLLTARDNTSKGNRCLRCWKRVVLSLALPSDGKRGR
jgi:hypothetical protein